MTAVKAVFDWVLENERQFRVVQDMVERAGHRR
jgi:hypothetical protein